MRLNELGESASGGWAVRLFTCGGCAFVGIWLLTWVLGRSLAPLKILAQSRSCQANTVRLTRAFQMYADDYDDRYMPTSRWMDNSRTYLPQTPGNPQLHCPRVSEEGETRYGYAMNSALSALERSKIKTPETTPLVYDSTNLQSDATDAVTSLPKPGRHRGRKQKGGAMKPGNSIGYANGRAGFVLDGEDKP